MTTQHYFDAGHHQPGECCCPCFFCDGPLPLAFEVNMSGWTDDICTECEALNGTFELALVESERFLEPFGYAGDRVQNNGLDCSWRYNFSGGPVCEQQFLLLRFVDSGTLNPTLPLDDREWFVTLRVQFVDEGGTQAITFTSSAMTSRPLCKSEYTSGWTITDASEDICNPSGVTLTVTPVPNV